MTYKVMFVTGCPGSGKSLLINTILDEVEDGTLEAVKEATAKEAATCVIRMNGVGFASIGDFLSALTGQLTQAKFGISRPSVKIVSTLQMKGLLASVSVCRNLIIFVDEIDHMLQCSSATDIESFCQLFRRDTGSGGLNAMLIGASNKIDLMFELKAANKLSLAELNNLVFVPYTSEQIFRIVKLRIEEGFARDENFNFRLVLSDELIDDFTLQFFAKKVTNNKNADLRQALDLCKMAFSKIASEGRKRARMDLTRLFKPILVDELEAPMRVSMKEALDLTNEFFNSASKAHSFVKDLSLAQLVVLLAIYELRKHDPKGCVVFTQKQIIEKTNAIAKKLSMAKLTSEEIIRIVEVLETYSLLEVRQKTGKSSNVALVVDHTYLDEFLKTNDFLRKYFV